MIVHTPAAEEQDAARVQLARYIAVGQVVEACGLLDIDLAELATLLQCGMAARTMLDGTQRWEMPPTKEGA